jgi:hypothetical protein
MDFRVNFVGISQMQSGHKLHVEDSIPTSLFL